MQEMISTFALAYLIVSVSISILMAYALQAIADKNELSDFARFLAWIPVLNLYPWLLSAGAAPWQFLRGAVGLAVAGVGVAVLSTLLAGPFGAVVSAVVGIAAALLLVVYFGKLTWALAERRDLAGWVGLLLFVPVLNVFALCYIAFHDGLVPLNKAGCAIGLLITLGSSVANYQMQQTMGSTLKTFEQGLKEARRQQPATADPGPRANAQAARPQAEATPGNPEPPAGDGLATAGPPVESAEAIANARAAEAVRAMMLMGLQFDALTALDSSDAVHAVRMQVLIDETRVELAMQRRALGDEATREFMRQLDEMEQSLPGAAPARLAAAAPPAAPARDAATPLEPCPPGTALRGAAPPAGRKAWCETTGAAPARQHGWFASWHPNGQLESKGEYRNGLRVGTWTRWSPSGARRVQASFERGLQHGPMIAWDQAGNVAREVIYRDGEPVSR